LPYTQRGKSQGRGIRSKIQRGSKPEPGLLTVYGEAFKVGSSKQQFQRPVAIS